ncbi:Prophage minor tail protein Z (GPZ) [Amphritea atlantica]|uniref:Prophage minor tail protein Z (GPZ) n=1 Tax=Amphritea atlantica TaxID=355243 RepID=A0A1H9GGA5_9GAMM|nr:phage tail protein [Amphritea atlantica]SEQ49142.1 Prophage minor tail protein Z (GPZ) [Amphritea atlantica]
MSLMSYDQQIDQLKRKLSAYKTIEVPRAASSALNKTIKASETRTVRGVAKAINVPQKYVRKRIYIKRSTARTLQSRLRSYYRGISVIDLNAKDTGKGGWSQRKGKGVKTSGKRQYSNAFIARGTNNQLHVFQRTGTARLPVDVVRIEIQQHVDVIAPKAAEREMRQGFERRLIHDLKWRLSKYEV